jgi:hypothetical protein
MSKIAMVGRGTEQLTVAGTSVGLAAIPAGARRAMIRVNTAGVYVENDGTDASTSAGMLVNLDSFIDMTDGQYNLSQYRFIQEASTSARLDINYYD